MINVSRIDIYNYLSTLFASVTPNVYSMAVPTTTTDDDVENGFIVIQVGNLNDESEFMGDAYAWARCYVVAYVPKKSRGRLNKEAYKAFEDSINAIILQAQERNNDDYYVLSDSVLSMDDNETTQKGNQFHNFIRSFVVVIDQQE